MRIGILSDTHVPEAPRLFPEILEALAGVDLILHAGDLVVARVLDELERIAPVCVVACPKRNASMRIFPACASVIAGVVTASWSV